MIVLAAFFIVILASASCPYGTRGRLPWVIVKGLLLAIIGAVLGIGSIPSRVKGYFVGRLAADWGDSPWYIRAAWTLLRPFFRGA